MRNKEKKARRVLKNTIETIRELGYYIRIPPMGPVGTYDGFDIARVEQVDLTPIPDELKRRMKDDQAK